MLFAFFYMLIWDQKLLHLQPEVEWEKLLWYGTKENL